VQFDRWMAEALEAERHEPNAMTLATADAQGRPHARIVLLKGWATEEGGFQFFTHYDSPKGRDLEAMPHTAVVLYWPVLERQVRAEGRAEKLEASASDAYFQRRPRASRLAAWVAAQSSPADSRDALEKRMAELERAYAEQEVPRPPAWGGYRLVPERVELWQGRESRLHDRLRYEADGAGGWRLARLAP
jgi:pyridoxamine 5'-phosphate oxidase